MEKAWSRAGRSPFPQGQTRETHLGLRWLLRFCFLQMLQRLLLDVWEFLTSSQRCPKSLVQESLEGKKPSPRCSNSVACWNGARPGQAPAHGEQPRPDAGMGFSQPRSARRERPLGGKGWGSSAEHRLQPQPRRRAPRGCAARGEPGGELTFSPEPLGELSSRWLSSQLRRLIQASSLMVSSDALRNYRREQERKRMFLCLLPGPFPTFPGPGNLLGESCLEGQSLAPPHHNPPSFNPPALFSFDTPLAQDKQEEAVPRHTATPEWH